MRAALIPVAVAILVVQSALAKDEAPLATHWTLTNTVEACALAQAVEVQKETGITPAQAREMKAFVDRWRKNIHDFRRANQRIKPEQWSEQYQKLLADAQKILSLEQVARLRQIYFQCEGVPSVALNHEQTKTLFALTHDQRFKLTELISKHAQKRAQAFMNLQARSKNAVEIFKAGREHETALLAELNEQALAMLNEQQQRAWQELIGKPFHGRLADAQGKQVHQRLDRL